MVQTNSIYPNERNTLLMTATGIDIAHYWVQCENKYQASWGDGVTVPGTDTWVAGAIATIDCDYEMFYLIEIRDPKAALPPYSYMFVHMQHTDLAHWEWAEPGNTDTTDLICKLAGWHEQILSRYI